MDEYHLIAVWHIVAPQQRVFDAVCDSLRWPDWWPGSDCVVEITPGDSAGIGSVRSYVWKGGLPYRLGFDAQTTRVAAPDLLEASVSGDLAGTGRWSFSHADGVTTVRYEWHVRTTRLWMRLSAPLVRRIFVMNHHALMKRGALGLAQRLDARLVGFRYGELQRASVGRPDWLAACLAGVLAGIMATVVQLALWWMTNLPVTGMLLRDSRLAAAIVLGQEVLPPPTTFDWTVMLAASLLHFALSIVYGLAMAPLITGRPRIGGILMGSLFGLGLFGLNMYGFTVLFPWFAVSRDWITAAAHLAFGLSCAIAYQALHERRRSKQH